MDFELEGADDIDIDDGADFGIGIPFSQPSPVTIRDIFTGYAFFQPKETMSWIYWFLMITYRVTITFLCFLAIFSTGISYPLTGPTMKYMSIVYELNQSIVSILFIVKAFGRFFGSGIMGFVCEFALKSKNYFGFTLHRIFFVAVAFTTVPLFVIPWVPWFASVCVLSLFQGFGSAALLMVSTIILRLIWSPKVVFPILQLLFSSFAFGRALSPLFVRLFLSFNIPVKISLVLIYTLAGMTGFVPCMIIFLPSPVRYVKIIKQIEEIGEEICEYGIGKKKSFKQRLKFLRITYFFFSCCSIVVFIGMSVSFQVLHVVYLVSVGWSESNATLVTSYYFFSFGLGRIIGIFEALLLSPVQVYFLDLCGIIVTMTVLLMFHRWKSVEVILFCFFFMGIFTSTALACFFTSSREFKISFSTCQISVLLACSAFGFALPFFLKILLNNGSVWFVTVILFLAVSSFCSFYVQFAVGNLHLHHLKKYSVFKNELVEYMKKRMAKRHVSGILDSKGTFVPPFNKEEQQRDGIDQFQSFSSNESMNNMLVDRRET